LLNLVKILVCLALFEESQAHNKDKQATFEENQALVEENEDSFEESQA
jgi:hypothetical protein